MQTPRRGVRAPEMCALVMAGSFLLSGCSGREPDAAPVSSAPVTPTSSSSSSSPAVVAPTSPRMTSCLVDVHIGTGAASAASDRAVKITRYQRGLTVACGGLDEVQIRDDRDTPAFALALTFGGETTVLRKGERAPVGPYEAVLVEQSGDDGKQMRFELSVPAQ
ncbi:hypothetical protein ACQPZF_17240 [Actinosynnema sp. CS-041913]|uniref:hypothetical protein n=1 Tax=Actinosynnema sp. CS-041913 TaxID=3239917 RepID=UPI003D8A0574